MSAEETIEVAILSSTTRYTNYDDTENVLARLINEDWVTMTKDEYAILVQHQYAIARKLGVDALVILQKPTNVQLNICFASIKELMKKQEDERISREKRNEKARKAAELRTKEQKAEKARKALEKAQKTLAELGVVV